jgi:exosortase A-associated hydrolase 1
VRAALDALFAAQPALRGCVIFGLCDAASAAMIYCPVDPRVRGLVLANPWVHTEAGEARAYVRHYYFDRLMQASFWRKVMAGEFDAGGSLRDLLGKLRAALPGSRQGIGHGSFQQRMLYGLRRFRGRVLVLVSGRDLTAAEFVELSGGDPSWQEVLQRPEVTVRRYDRADHTFSSPADHGVAIADCLAWIGTLPGR